MPNSKSTQAYFSQSNLWTEAIAPYQAEVLADILAILPSDINNILDVGCGNGLITNQLPNSLHVVGLDRSEEALKYVKKETVLGDILQIPLDDESFDLVICNDVLEHLTSEEREQALRELARVSRQYILITVPFLEDLNQGITKCADCGKYYHLNHHLFSFDLDITSKLFESFNYYCIRQVLSGDISYGEPPEIILMRRLLSDFPPHQVPVCLHCGGQKVLQSQDSNSIVSPLIAKLFLNNPALLDWHTRRTECISLFSQENKIIFSLSDKPTKKFIDKNNHQICLKSEVVINNQILFRKREFYYHSFLPRISRLPYYHSNNIQINADGIKLIEKQSLLLGFFNQAHQKNISLILSGFSEQESSLVVSQYNDLHGYTLPIFNQVEKHFSISLDFPASLSSYGFLFEISISKGNVTIIEATLENVNAEEVTIYNNKNKQARFWRSGEISSNILDISLPIYGEFIIAQNLKNQTQTKIQNQIIDSYLSINPEILENTSINTCVSILSEEISDKNRLNISLKAEYQSLQTQHQQLQTQHQQLQTQHQQLQTQHQQLLDKHKQTLEVRIKRKIISLGKGKYFSSEEFKHQILDSIKPNLVDTQWMQSPEDKKSFLMICHDQNIDRRIIQQAETLIEAGWQGKIICLSFDNEDHLEKHGDISIHRIGLAKIVPDCPIYWRYQNRQRFIGWWGRSFSILSKINWFYYKVKSRWEYQGKHACYPLPFDFIFYITAKCYPADLIIAHDLPALKASHKLAKEWGITLGYDAHELYYEQNVFSKKKKKLMRQIEQKLIRECDVVFTVNRSIAEEMVSRYQISMPNVLLNAINPPQDFDPKVRYLNLRDYFQLAADQKILLFQGGLEKGRNLENLVQAMRYVTVSNLVLIFMGNGSLKEILQKSVNKYNLTSKVLFKEAVPQDELIYWTASADVGIIPYPHVDLNTYYCTPNKLFEFIQAQLPIIANDSPELRRFVHETRFGRVGSMQTAQEIARLIDNFVNDNGLIKQAQENLSNHFHEFTWSSQKDDYIRSFQKSFLE